MASECRLSFWFLVYVFLGCVCVLFCTVSAVKGLSLSFLSSYVVSLQGYAVMGPVWFFKAIFYEVSVLSWKEDVIPLRGGDKEEKKKELLLEVSVRNHYVSAVAKEVVSLNSSVNTIRGLSVQTEISTEKIAQCPPLRRSCHGHLVTDAHFLSS